MVGTAFGHFRVTGPLGAGGMGEVWRAQDTRLGREVALKMLPEELAYDPERMARFTREAKVLASLNHPNIAVLYGLETVSLSRPSGSAETTPEGLAGGDQPVTILVMELIEGQGLDELIARGPIPFDEAVSIALQVAEGLQAAHERGIVHRDLKPANIKVRPDGTVKVLDFGLATTWTEGSAEDSQSLYPTLTQHRTALGVLIGTAAYMSPEQARGKPVDRRTDIWAFGCVLYEMLTGSHAFLGATLSDTMAAVLKDEPDWNGLPDGIEPVARHVLRRCLAKDPARRFHDIADVRIELDEAVSVAEPAHEKRRRGWKKSAVSVIAAGALIAAAVIAVQMAMRGPAASLPTFRALTFRAGHVSSARFAADGKTVVFGMSTRGQPLTIRTTRADSVESMALDLPPADILGISRTGQMAILLGRHCEGSWVSVGTLGAAELAGGASRPIIERVNDGDISADGSRMAVVREVGQTQRLEYPLGKVLFETHGWISHVRISPDGTHVAFLHHPYYGDDRGQAAMVDTAGKLTTLSEELSDSLQGLAWSPDGRSVWFSGFVFGRGGVLWSVRPGSRPVERLISPVAMRIQDLSPDGRALVIAGDSRAEIAGLLAGQDHEQRYEGWNDDSIGGLAADGSLFAGNIQVSTVNGEYAAFARRGDGSPPVRVGYGDVFGVSPRGRWVFTQRLTGDRRKLVLLPTGPGEPRVIDLGNVKPVSSGSSILTCSLDGKRATFEGFVGDVGPQIYVLNVDQGTLQTAGPVGASGPVISPDGTRVACLAPDGTVTVYSLADGQPSPVPGLAAGERPIQWSRDGRSLLVWNSDFPAQIHRVSLGNGHRELVLQIMPQNPTGVLYGQILMAPGGDYYVYRYRRDLSTLFLVNGIR